MSIGFNPGFGFDDADDVARGTAFRTRIDKSSPLKSPQGVDHEDEIDSIVSPRDPQAGLPTGQVWDDTDIVHVVADGDAGVNMTYGDIEFDVVGRPELGDTGTHEVGHVRGAIQKRLPGTSAENFTPPTLEVEQISMPDPGSDEPTANMSLNFEEVKQQIRSEFDGDILGVTHDHAAGFHTEVQGMSGGYLSSVQADGGPDADDGDGVWADDWESPVN